MASTYTPNLRLTEQGDNDNPNTWGDILNAGVIDLIDEAIAGITTINVTGISDINIATTVVSGGTDDARSAVIKLTGTLGADIDLIVPSLEKVYQVDAQHTGGIVRVIPQGGGAGIDFNPGDTSTLYTNGTDIQAITPTDVLKGVNNLSDVADVPTALVNLGLDDTELKLVGKVILWPTLVAPTGYLFCNGSQADRTVYADLFAVIGVTYGVGNGSTTFNLPNFNGRSPIGVGTGNTAEGGGVGSPRALGEMGGAEEHTLTLSETPDHDHGILNSGNAEGSGTFVENAGSGISQTINTELAGGGGLPHNNMTPFFGINFAIFTGV